MRWPKVPLAEVLRPAANPVPVNPEGDYPIMGVYGFARGPITRPAIKGSETSAKQLFQVRRDQFVYSKLKAFEGAFAIVTNEVDGYYTSNEFPSFEIDRRRAEPGYLRWLFCRPETWADIARDSTGIGARRERLNPEQLLNYAIPLPPLEYQHRIVARLDRAAALVQARREAVAAAGADLQSLLTKAFHRIAADAPRLPMREVAPLVRRPVAIDLDARYPELGVRSFGRGTFHKPELAGSDVGTKKLFRIEPGDLVFNIVFAWEGAVAVAQPSDSGRVGSHRFLTCVPRPELATAALLSFYFQTTEGIEKLRAASPGGAGRNRTLGVQKLEEIAVPVPDSGAQEWFLRLLHRTEELRRIRAASTTDIDALLPALLNETFSERSEAA
jgi:type I restriction enzyme S subunit